MAEKDEAPSPRAAFTARLCAYAADHPDLSAGEVSSAVAKQLLSEDRGLIESFLLREGHIILTLGLRSTWLRTRRGIYRTVSLVRDGEPETDVEERAPSIFEQIRNWREFDPVTRQARLLLTFNKTALQQSAAHDGRTAVHYAWKATWKQQLADGLPDDITTVAEHYAPEQILEMLELSKADRDHQLKRGHFRIKVSPAAPALQKGT